MSSFFKRLASNRAVLATGTAMLLGGSAYLYARYRYGQNSQAAPLRITGHWIGHNPVMPSHIPSTASPDQREAMSDYLTQTHMNMQHPNMETVQRRATAFRNWEAAENNMLNATRDALRDPSSTHFQFSSHMAHNERRILSDRADHLRVTSPDANTKLSAEVTRMTTERSQGVGPAYNTLTDMLIQGKRGPLTLEQSGMGVESTIVGHHVLDKTPQYSVDNPRIQAARPIDPETGRSSHATSSPHGMDLSEDPGTQMREPLGLPVMTGTSGSASDVVRSYNYTRDYLQQIMPDRRFLPATEHRETIKDLAFNWMRRGAPMHGVRGLITENQRSNNFEKISTPAPTATQTHTFSEIAAGVDLTLDGKSQSNLARSTRNSLERMDTFRR